MLFLASCGGDSGSKAQAASGSAQLAPTTTETIEIADGALAGELCDGLASEPSGTVETEALVETSGLASSQQHDGLLWAHNDSGQAPVLYGFDRSGSSLAQIEIAVDATDIEAMAITSERVYLADIGDNNAARLSISVHWFPEPDPGDTGLVQDVTSIELVYPDGPRDAEAFLLDPVTGDLLIIDKRFTIGGRNGAPLSAVKASVYAASPPFDTSRIELREVGTIDLETLAERAQAPSTEGLIGMSGVGGLVTDADISADGTIVALRTYDTVWLFSRSEGESVADALSTQPCEAATLPEEQGEAIALLGAGSAFATISEGSGPAINVTE